MKSWKELGFEIETTGDGSPSLRLLQSLDPSRDKGEAMHHSGGAMSETELIYGSVIRECFTAVQVPHFCVVGLGLGYIELVIAREALRAGKDFRITSYEIRSELKDFFITFLKSQPLPKEIQEVYQSVISYVSSKEQETLIKDLLIDKMIRDEFQLQGPLEALVFPDIKVNCFLYDAYSSKTDPHLWSEDFLIHFLNQNKASVCFFSTYASRGTLKRALAATGFLVETNPGFQGKRNSTKARYRGVSI